MKTYKYIFMTLSFLLLTAGQAFAEWGGYPAGGMGKVPLLLLAMVGGYWVLTLSQQQQKPLDLLGRIVGGIVLLIATGGLLCAAFFGLCRWKGCSGASWCPTDKSHKACPFSYRRDTGEPSLESSGQPQNPPTKSQNP